MTCGYETTTGGWIVTFLLQVRNAPEKTAGYAGKSLFPFLCFPRRTSTPLLLKLINILYCNALRTLASGFWGGLTLGRFASGLISPYLKDSTEKVGRKPLRRVSFVFFFPPEADFPDPLLPSAPRPRFHRNLYRCRLHRLVHSREAGIPFESQVWSRYVAE